MRSPILFSPMGCTTSVRVRRPALHLFHAAHAPSISRQPSPPYQLQKTFHSLGFSEKDDDLASCFLKCHKIFRSTRLSSCIGHEQQQRMNVLTGDGRPLPFHTILTTPRRPSEFSSITSLAVLIPHSILTIAHRLSNFSSTTMVFHLLAFLPTSVLSSKCTLSECRRSRR